MSDTSPSSVDLDPGTVLVVTAAITGSLVLLDFTTKLTTYLFGVGSDWEVTASMAAGPSVTAAFKTRNGVPPRLATLEQRSNITDSLTGLVLRALNDLGVGFSGILTETP